jgi:polyphosphate kinase
MTRSKPSAGKKRVGRKPKVIEHPLSSETEFTNREIGWLNFNRRVLHEAEDGRNPLLERLRFLSIVNSNLDEFFMKRVGGLKRQVAFAISARSSDGKTSQQQLVEIRQQVLPMVKEQGRVFSQVLKPALKEKSIFLLKWNELSSKEKEHAQKYYLKNVFPVLTPLSVDPGHPFPFISNLSTSLAVTLRHPDRGDEKLFARVKIPQVLPQWVRLESEKPNDHRFVSLVEMIKENLHDLFPSMQVLNVMPFRITRNADITRDEEDAEDLLLMIEEELRMRRFAEVVRIEHGPNPDPWILSFLMEELELQEDDVYELPEELDLDYRGLDVVADLNIAALRYELWTPTTPMAFLEDDAEQIFGAIRHHDRLVHHPYESFNATVERFIRVSADDPKVVAIKMTLYRTGDNSPFIKSLIRAAENGKQVVCLVELKARFDEERNIYWAQELENAGVHVVYGVVGLKTHAKTSLVVRQESDGLRCYAHIGTGNYNVTTGRLYTDLGLFTASEPITSELVQFFHYLTGRSLKSDYKHLLIAPVNMSQRFRYMIDREAENARQKKPANIFVKMNSMEENDIVMALYNASQAGAEVDMVVRGFCCLRPGVKGLSEKVRVYSAIGRFLEHSRLFYFRNGAVDPIDGEFYIGSADWMYRNLHARVECVTPIYDRNLRERLWELIQLHLKDHRQTWEMNSSGNYTQRTGTDTGLHQQLMGAARQRSAVVDESDPSLENRS